MKPKWYYNDTYKMNYYFYLGWKPEDFKKYLKEDCPGIEESDGRTMEIHNGKAWIYHIWIRTKKNLPALVHECVHAAGFTLEKVGIKADWSNDEAHTYLTEALFRNAIRREGK